MVAKEIVNEFYDGSMILDPLTPYIGLTIDKVNFVASQLLCLMFGLLYRIYLGPHRASPAYRHVVQILIGIPLTYFCFGSQIVHLFAQSAFCLVLIHTLEPGCMEKAVLIIAVGYLCICHLYRTIYDYGGYTLDITGPLMLNTQRLSSLAFSLRDGSRFVDQTKLTKLMKLQAIRECPTLLEFTSYIFCFHGLMCGPFCFYKDYLSFIHGTNYYTPANTSARPKTELSMINVKLGNGEMTSIGGGTTLHESSSDVRILTSNGLIVTPNHVDKPNNQGSHVGDRNTVPFVPCSPLNPKAALYQKLFTTLCFGIMTICVLPRYPATILTGPEFSNHSFLYKMLLIQLYAALQRQKYYFAWKLGESVNVAAGLGFNGYDDKGAARWDLIDNADIYKVEFCTSLKELLDNWNKSTTAWLRYVVYERLNSTIPVFLFSALWHGFYAGYYVTFCTGGMFIQISRMMRRHVRPWFQTNAILRFIYDTITFVSTRIAIAYLGFPFLVLELSYVLAIYRGVYFWMHIAAAVLGLSVILKLQVKRRTKEAKKEQ